MNFEGFGKKLITGIAAISALSGEAKGQVGNQPQEPVAISKSITPHPDTLIVHDPKDHRLQEYKDSVTLNKVQKKIIQFFEDNPNAEYLEPDLNSVYKDDLEFQRMLALYKKKGVFWHKILRQGKKVGEQHDLGINTPSTTHSLYLSPEPVQPVVYKPEDTIESSDPFSSPTIITHDINDPRIKAYADSEYAYEQGEKFYKEGTDIFDKDTTAFNKYEKKNSPLKDERIKHLKPDFSDYVAMDTRDTVVDGVKKNKEKWNLNKLVKFPQYKKPTNPVFAERPASPQTIVTHNPEDPRLTSFVDSTYAHDEIEKINREVQKILREDIPNEEKVRKIRECNRKYEDLANQDRVKKMEWVVEQKVYKEKGKKDLHYTIIHYRKPVQEVLYEKEPPIKEMPNLHPVYGPNGGLIGTLPEWGPFIPVQDTAHLDVDTHREDVKVVQDYLQGKTHVWVEYTQRDNFGLHDANGSEHAKKELEKNNDGQK